MDRALSAVERFGNRLPEPVTLFAATAALFVLASSVFAGVAVRHPGTGATVRVESLATATGLQRMLVDAVPNFAAYPPLATVLVVLIGVGIAERSGLVSAVLRAVVASVPPRWVTAAIVFTGVMASLAADAGIIVIPPLAAIVFARMGRPPLAGLAAAFAGVSGGFSANLFITPLDPLLAGITQTAARIVDETYVVSPAANYYFMVASTVMLTVVGTLVTERLVEPRLREEARRDSDETRSVAEDTPAAGGGDDAHPAQARALRATGIAAVCVVAGLYALGGPADAPLRDANGSPKPFFDAIVILTSLSFGVLGVVYGAVVGSVRSDRDAARMAADTLGTMGGYLLVAFVAAQVIAYLGRSNLGIVLAVEGAEALRDSGIGGFPLLFVFMVGCGLLDFLVASASAKWALLAPVAVPMLMLLGFSPEVVQAAYRVTDSTTNIVTPLMPYFPAILAFVRRHRGDAGVGTVIALMLPYSIAFAVVWTLMLFGWDLAGLPFGPGVPSRFVVP